MSLRDRDHASGSKQIRCEHLLERDQAVSRKGWIRSIEQRDPKDNDIHPLHSPMPMFFAPLILEGFGDGRLATRDNLRQTMILRPHTGLPVDQTPGKTLRAHAAIQLVVNSGSVQHKETVQKPIEFVLLSFA